jgi:hypothetical protein
MKFEGMDLQRREWHHEKTPAYRLISTGNLYDGGASFWADDTRYAIASFLVDCSSSCGISSCELCSQPGTC